MTVMISDNEEHDMFMSCQYCGIYHTPDLLWLKASKHPAGLRRLVPQHTSTGEYNSA